jgi:DNA-directed RNA polymerase subunit beta'
MGKIDRLNGFKENVITGHLIPAGTGTELMQSIRLKYLGTEIEPELPAQQDEEQDHSIEEIAATWRDSVDDDDDLLEFDPEEANEFLPEIADGMSEEDSF